MTVCHTDITSEGYVRASVAIQKLACIVRKLPPKRKFNSSTVAIPGIDKDLQEVAWAFRLSFSIDAAQRLCYGDHRNHRE
jgi:hypothetical protein